MGFSHYVGRVGALAVALGIGTAVAFPGVALADDGTSAASSDGPAAADASDASSTSTGGDEQSSGVVTTTGPTTRPATGSGDSSASTAGDGSTPPPGTVSAQTNTGTSRADADGSVEDTPEPDSGEPPAVDAPMADEPLTEEPPANGGSATPTQETAATTPAPHEDSPTSLDAASSSGSDAAAAAPTMIRPVDAPVALTVPTVRSETTQPTARRDVAATPPVTVASVSAASTMTTAAFAPPPSLDPIGALLAAPAAIVGTVLNAVLTPFFGGAPAAPAQPTLLWTVLAFVRREIQRTFFNSTPTATAQTVTLTLPSAGSVSVPIPLSGTDVDGDRLTYSVPARGTLGGPAHGTVTVDQATGTFRYDPDDAFALTGGTDTFTYTVSDAAARRTLFGIPLSFSPTSSTATVTLVVNGVAQAPVARPDTLTLAEDTTGIVDVLANDSDPDGDALTLTGITAPSHGVATYGPGGLVTYAPARDFSGSDTLSYTVSDGTGRTATGTLTITVTGVNDPPVAADDTVTVAENGTVVVDVLANDTDVDDTLDPATVTVVTGPTHGTVTIDPVTGRITYVHDGDEATPDTFTYTVADRVGATSNTATVTVRISGVNDAPVGGGPQTVTVREDTATTITLTGTDADGDTLTFTITTPPSHGTLGPVVRVDATTATVVYTPDADHTGADTFAYTVGDGTTTSIAPATVSITVTPVNDAPVIDAVVSRPGTGNTWTVTVTASDPDGDVPTTTLTSADPQHVTVTGGAGGVYTVTVTDTAWATTHPGYQLAVIAGASDGTADGEARTTTIGTVNNATAVGGRFELPALPAGVTYTSFAASDTHSVLLRSDGQVIATGTNVFGQLDVPALPSGTRYTGVAVVNGTTVLLRSDGQALVVGRDVTGGTAIPAPPPGLRYTQAALSLNHLVLLRSDGNVTALGLNGTGQTDVPALPDGLAYTQVAAGTAHTVLLRSDGQAFSIGNRSGGRLDVPALPAGTRYTQIAAAEFGTVLLRSDGQAVILSASTAQPPALPVLPGGLTYTAVATSDLTTVALRSDGQAFGVGVNSSGETDIPALPAGVEYTHVFAPGGRTTILLRGLAVPRPVASADSATVAEGTTTTIDVLANDTHAGGATLAVTGVSQPTHGTATFTATGVTYAPSTGYHGTDTFTYTVGDGTNASVGTVTVTVDAAPVYLGVEDKSSVDWIIQPLFADYDGKPVTATLTGGPHLQITPVTFADVIFGYRIRVTDATWASRHIGETVSVTLTVDDGVNAPLVQRIDVGAVGNVRGVGLNFSRQLDIPALPVGMQYTAVTGANGFTVLLRSDGTVVTAGVRRTPFTIPPLPTGMTYTAVAAGYDTVVLLRSDGQVFATGDNEYGQLNIPPGTYTQISAGGGHVLALRADGTVVGAGTNLDGQLTIPAPPAGVVYTGVSAGDYHSVFLRSDGQAVSTDPLIEVPDLPDGVRYTQVASGADGSVFLRSDGQAVLSDLGGVDMMPALPDGVVYTAVAAGQGHVVLLRSDGTAIAVGSNRDGQLNIPTPMEGNRYTAIGAGYFESLLIEAPSRTV